MRALVNNSTPMSIYKFGRDFKVSFHGLKVFVNKSEASKAIARTKTEFLHRIEVAAAVALKKSYYQNRQLSMSEPASNVDSNASSTLKETSEPHIQLNVAAEVPFDSLVELLQKANLTHGQVKILRVILGRKFLDPAISAGDYQIMRNNVANQHKFQETSRKRPVWETENVEDVDPSDDESVNEDPGKHAKNGGN
jgi:hypothetical protein